MVTYWPQESGLGARSGRFLFPVLWHNSDKHRRRQTTFAFRRRCLELVMNECVPEIAGEMLQLRARLQIPQARSTVVKFTDEYPICCKCNGNLLAGEIVDEFEIGGQRAFQHKPGKCPLQTHPRYG